jgi:hypothetical protein
MVLFVLQDGHRTSHGVINTSGKASDRLFQHSVFLGKQQGTHTLRNSGVTQLNRSGSKPRRTQGGSVLADTSNSNARKRTIYSYAETSSRVRELRLTCAAGAS